MTDGKPLNWKLMYEGPHMGNLFADPVFIRPFVKGKETVMGKLSDFAYRYYLWYSDANENGGYHGAYYEQSDLDAALEHGKTIYFDQAWLDEWYRLIDTNGEKVLDLMRTYTLEETIDTTPKEMLIDAVPKFLELYYLLVSYLRCSQPQFTDALRNRLYELVREHVQSNDEVEEAVLTLTLPEERSPFTEEEIEWLSLLADAKHAIAAADIEALSHELLAERYPGIFERLELHLKKHSLIPASDRTPAWDIAHFLQLLRSSLATDVNPEERRDRIIDQYAHAVERKKELVANYELPDEALVLGQRIAKVGLYRFRSGFYFRWMGYYVVLVAKRLANELGMTYAEVTSTTEEEFMGLLKGEMPVTHEELTRRARAQSYIRLPGEDTVLWGEEALKAKNEALSAIDYSKITEIKGEVGSRGHVTGIAYVFHWSDDVVEKMRTMPKGSILVAPQTHPTYMPAIRLASALVCDEGGITGHAAIVSRELHKPCVIGVHIGTRVIRTGDEIEVDAMNGYVRILKRADAGA